MRRRCGVAVALIDINGFDRGDDFKVTATPRAGCEWVLAGEGVPTEKLDGTNTRVTIKRRDFPIAA